MNRRLAAGVLAGTTSLLSLLAPVPAAVAAEPAVDRTVRDPRITESSGLAVSPTHDRVLWTHDDSGNPPLLFALAPSGRVAGTLRIPGVPNVDWEAMAAFRDRTGHDWLAAADIGDNEARRSSVEVEVVPEPARLAAVVEAPRLRLRLRYPDGPRDAETLLVDTARGRMFVVSKGLFGGTVYAVPASAWDGRMPASATIRPATLVAVGTVPLVLVTDGTIAPDGTVLLRTYGELATFGPFPLDGGTRLFAPRATTALPDQQQGEGLALAPGGRSVLLSSEGTGQPVLRFALPHDMEASFPTATPTTAAGSPSARPADAGVAAEPDAGRLIRVGAWTGAAVAGLVAVAGLAAAAALRIRRRAGGRAGNRTRGPRT